ncbi:MAG: YggU family protein [Anaerolineales bacterium]|nr:YggU family protein [Anaerolineales bacterium]
MSDSIVRIAVKVQPGARKNGITGYSDSVLRVKIAAPPIEGKANKELIAYFSDILDVRKSAITIEKGQTSRNKLISIEGVDEARLSIVIDDILRSGTQNKLF